MSFFSLANQFYFFVYTCITQHLDSRHYIIIADLLLLYGLTIHLGTSVHEQQHKPTHFNCNQVISKAFVWTWDKEISFNVMVTDYTTNYRDDNRVNNNLLVCGVMLCLNHSF